MQYLKGLNLKQSAEQGFTLIELIIAMAVLAIAVAIAGPGFGAMLQDNQQTGYINTTLSNLSFARSHAVKDGDIISVCGSSDQASCNQANFSSGWLIFADNDGDGTVDAGDNILRVVEAPQGSATMRVTGFGGATTVQFSDRGELIANAQGTFILCPRDNDATEARAFVLNVSGMGRLAVDEGNNTAVVNDHGGADVTCP
mgnify:CR=1 FL=1